MESALESRPRKTRPKNIRRHDLEARASLLGQRLARFLAQLETTGTVANPRADLGISPAAYMLYRRNQGNPTIGSLAVMAHSLGCSVYEILGFQAEEVQSAYTRADLSYDPADDHGLGELLARALAHRETLYKSQTEAIAHSGTAPTPYNKYRQNKGNPTFKSLEWMAENFGTSVYELLWFDLDDVRAAYRRAGLDYDKMAGQIRRQNREAARFDDLRASA